MSKKNQSKSKKSPPAKAGYQKGASSPRLRQLETQSINPDTGTLDPTRLGGLALREFEEEKAREERHEIQPGPRKMAADALLEKHRIDPKIREAARTIGADLLTAEGGPGNPVGPQGVYEAQAFQTRREGDAIVPEIESEEPETADVKRVGQGSKKELSHTYSGLEDKRSESVASRLRGRAKMRRLRARPGQKAFKGKSLEGAKRERGKKIAGKKIAVKG